MLSFSVADTNDRSSKSMPVNTGFPVCGQRITTRAMVSVLSRASRRALGYELTQLLTECYNRRSVGSCEFSVRSQLVGRLGALTPIRFLIQRFPPGQMHEHPTRREPGRGAGGSRTHKTRTADRVRIGCVCRLRHRPTASNLSSHSAAIQRTTGG